MSVRRLIIVALAALLAGCSVNVAELTIAAPRLPSPEMLQNATSRGHQAGESCRFWFLFAHFGLPKVDEAMDNAMRPVGGVYMRDVTVYSVHPVYGVCGWHCYRVVGEVFG